ncbi:hypothetical protein M9H77_09350 [Catharanthus roseus]|uniref:Uncharacterized protein n=1 Tax=Catharanthus roseus TaxID=4058 RepID=A0ACC0C0H2_CATRO|nr:hypothetical protein M9H77_09350 [Catharanthus roseus]
MRVPSTAGKCKRIKTHQHSFYPQTSGCHNEVIGITFRHLVLNTSQTPYECSITKQPLSQNWSKQATDSWGIYQVYPGTNISFKPLQALDKAAILPQSMMRCPRRSIGPCPPRYYAPLQVDPLS